MPTATANGKKFNFPDGATPEQMGQAIDEYFSSQKQAPEETPASPTDGMGTGELMAAGAGKFMVDQGRGLQQAQSDLATANKAVADGALDAFKIPGTDIPIGPGLIRYAPSVQIADFIAGKLGITDENYRAKLQADIDEAKKRDAALMETGAGKTGYIGGALATGLATPGGFGATGRGLVGAVTGGTQPVASDESRAVNAGIGAGAGVLLPPLVTGAAKGVGRGIAKEAPNFAASVTDKAGKVANAYRSTMDRANNNLLRALPKVSAAPTSGAAASGEVVEDVATIARQGAERAGFAWDSLDDGLKARINAQIQDALDIGTDLPPEALVRRAVLQSQGITPTRAMITRDFGDAFNEQNLMREPEGGQIRQAYTQANQAVRQNIQGLAPEGVDAVGPSDFGAAFRRPIERGEQLAQNAANKVYNKALEVEGENLTPMKPLHDYIETNAEALYGRDATRPIVDKLRQYGVISKRSLGVDKTMQYDPLTMAGVTKSKQLTLRELSGIRSEVNTIWKSAIKSGDGVTEARANELRKVLDAMEEGAGGELYKAYRQIRIGKGERYENNPAIDKLLKSKSGYVGTDLIEDSEVFDKIVLGQSQEQFAKVWPRLSPKARDLTKAQVAKYIEDQVFSGMGTNEAGDVVASAAKLNRTLIKLGPEKLKTVFGEEGAQGLQLLAKSLREISNPPQGTVPQGSAPAIKFLSNNILGTLRSMAKRAPVVGDMLEGAAQLAEAGAKSRANQAAADAAIDPLLPARQAAAERTRNALLEAQQRRMGPLGAGAAAATVAGSRQSR